MNINISLNNFEAIRDAYNKFNAWGLMTSIDLANCDAEIIRDADAIKKYVKELCDFIEMKCFGETTVVNFGEDENVSGYSMTQLIETSLVSGHFANKTNSAYIDIFSCKIYDPYKSGEFSKEFFKAENININVLLRK